MSKNSFSGRIGFVLAAAGSAVGLGNIWRFPYLAAKYGGGMFLLVYIILTVTFGFSIMLLEIALGRKTESSPLGAFKKLSPKFSFLGVLTSLITLIILPYYCVVGGWVLKYFVAYVTGGYAPLANASYYDSYISQPVEPVVYLFVFVALSFAIILMGVQKGIERANKILMPALIILTLIITIYSLTLDGALEGVKYYLTPHPDDFSANTILAAMGQMFYSMSLASGIMITFGMYLPKDADIEKSVKQIELFDIGIAFLAGLMIVPAVFAFSGGDRNAIDAGPGLMFKTLPMVFEKMGMTFIIGSLFFLLVLFAALSSAISMLEVIVANLEQRFRFNRTKASIVSALLVFVIGLPSALGYGVWSGFRPFGMLFLDFFDFIGNSVIMPVVALLTCIFAAYVIAPNIITDEVELSSKFRQKRMYNVVVKYVAPVLILIILVSKFLELFGVISL